MELRNSTSIDNMHVKGQKVNGDSGVKFHARGSYGKQCLVISAVFGVAIIGKGDVQKISKE